MLLAGLSAGFQSLPLLPTSKLSPPGADSQVGAFVYVLEPWGSLQWILLWGWKFLMLPQHPQVFSVRGFGASFPWAGTLGCVVYLPPQLFLLIYWQANVGPPTFSQTYSYPVWEDIKKAFQAWIIRTSLVSKDVMQSHENELCWKMSSAFLFQS